MMYFTDDVDDLLVELTENSKGNDVQRIRKTLVNIQTVTNSGIDTKPLFPAVVKHLASSDILTKKLVCWFICYHGDESELILLAINTLVKDCCDSNPMVRGLALKSLSILPQKAMAEYWTKALADGLCDSSAYVRRIAAVACAKLNQLDPNAPAELDLVDTLYSMVRDQDPIVVVNCLLSLEEILHDEGGVVVNKNMAHHLLNKFKIFSDWNIVTVLGFLKKYRPKTEEESLDIMNIVDCYLKHSNSGVVVAVVDYLLFLVEIMPHLRLEVYRRAKPQILHCLKTSNHELTMMLLEYCDRLLEEDRKLLQSDHKHFFCKYSEPVYVKVKKLKILSSLVYEENMSEILEELSLCCMDLNADVICTAINSIGKVAQTYPALEDKCMEKLLELLSCQEERVICEALKVLQEVNFEGNGHLQRTMEAVERCISYVEDTESKGAVLWLLGEQGQHLESSPYLLEQFAQSIEEEPCSSLQLNLLEATVKLFLKRPAECQDVLGQALGMCMDSGDVDVRDRALFYYQLLKTGVMEAKNVVQS